MKIDIVKSLNKEIQIDSGNRNLQNKPNNSEGYYIVKPEQEREKTSF